MVDGDTLWIEGHKIRVADIDAPEISTPKCSSELDLGNRATDRLIELVNEGPFELHAWPGRDTDRYGRQLRVLVRSGRSLGDILVSEGLARTWTGRREPCAEVALHHSARPRVSLSTLYAYVDANGKAHKRASKLLGSKRRGKRNSTQT